MKSETYWSFHDNVLENALDDMGLSEQAILRSQERCIVRLRAALLTLGMTPKEINRIAQDDDDDAA